jgi:hypothetical protein
MSITNKERERERDGAGRDEMRRGKRWWGRGEVKHKTRNGNFLCCLKISCTDRSERKRKGIEEN